MGQLTKLTIDSELVFAGPRARLLAVLRLKFESPSAQYLAIARPRHCCVEYVITHQ